MVSCRDIDTIKASADPDKNTGMGGHLTQHIYGMRPPTGLLQTGKTLFAKRKDFESAWRQYLYIASPCNCGGGGQAQQQVTLEKLGMKWLDAYSCTSSNANGECDQYTLYTAKEIFYGFLLVGQTWILNTCFPVPLT